MVAIGIIGLIATIAIPAVQNKCVQMPVLLRLQSELDYRRGRAAGPRVPADPHRRRCRVVRHRTARACGTLTSHAGVSPIGAVRSLSNSHRQSIRSFR
ncbi:MAG: hypothetical protein KF774_14985 [Planctomyces sp.]|nr:hypothetical protein [Planctomyces sp.]